MSSTTTAAARLGTVGLQQLLLLLLCAVTRARVSWDPSSAVSEVRAADDLKCTIGVDKPLHTQNAQLDQVRFVFGLLARRVAHSGLLLDFAVHCPCELGHGERAVLRL
jgi:hypothetical protein